MRGEEQGRLAGLVVVVGAPKEVDPERGQSGRLAGLDAVGARPHSRSAPILWRARAGEHGETLPPTLNDTVFTVADQVFVGSRSPGGDGRYDVGAETRRVAISVSTDRAYNLLSETTYQEANR